MKSPRRRRGSAGFTIIELMMASGVFSLAILVAVGGFLAIGRLFYKGVSGTQTNEISRQIVNDISASIAQADSLSPLQTGNGYSYYCIGNNRYTFARSSSGQPIQANLSQTANLDPNSSGPNFGLLKDKLSGSSACGAPCPPGVTPGPGVSGCPAGSVPLNFQQELLGDQMWLGDLTICQPGPSSPPPCTYGSSSGPNLYIVSLVLAYGDSAAIKFDMSNPLNDACAGGASTQQYCSVVKLSTAIHRGIGL